MDRGFENRPSNGVMPGPAAATAANRDGIEFQLFDEIDCRVLRRGQTMPVCGALPQIAVPEQFLLNSVSEPVRVVPEGEDHSVSCGGEVSVDEQTSGRRGRNGCR
jgi:hypothetical protein